MKKILLMMTLLLTTCMREGLRDGDLVFQENDPGDFTGAIENVTGGNWSHVGILEVTGDGVHVLEATTTRGVVRTPLEVFLDGSAHDGDGRPLVRVYRLVDPASGDPGLTEQEAREAVRRAHGYIAGPMISPSTRGWMPSIAANWSMNVSSVRTAAGFFRRGR